MRTVVKNSEVYHLWAHQSQPHAHSNNRSFSGNAANSYAALIGLIKTNEQGVKAYLLTSQCFNVTTTQAQSDLRRAIPPGSIVFTLPSLYASGCNQAAHADNVAALLVEIAGMYNKANRARQNKPYLLAQVEHGIAHVKAFAAWVGLPEPPADITGIADARAEAERLQAEEMRAAAERRKAKAEADLLEFKTDTLPKWFAGEDVYFSYWDNAAYLRVVGDTCETSHGATVPLAHVQRVIRQLERKAQGCEDTGREYIPHGDIRIGHYKLYRIEADGTVVIGCHRFEIDEVRRIAALLRSLPVVDVEIPA